MEKLDENIPFNIKLNFFIKISLLLASVVKAQYTTIWKHRRFKHRRFISCMPIIGVCIPFPIKQRDTKTYV